jgi:hypothetical protein
MIERNTAECPVCLGEPCQNDQDCPLNLHEEQVESVLMVEEVRPKRTRKKSVTVQRDAPQDPEDEVEPDDNDEEVAATSLEEGTIPEPPPYLKSNLQRVDPTDLKMANARKEKPAHIAKYLKPSLTRA